MNEPAVAEVLRPVLDAAMQDLAPVLGQWPASQQAQARRVLAASPFVRAWCLRHPQEIEGMLQGQTFALPPAEVLEDFDRELRLARNRAMVRIAWRELAAQVSAEHTVQALSELADVCLQACLDWHLQAMRGRHGVARQPDGEPAGFVILALGKLGGRELNFSSDVDLIFAYSAAGESDGARPLSNEQYFIRLGQRIMRSMQDISEHGFVFRVDLRLRPFGEQGPIAHSLSALEDYYEAHGREWERYAWIKARVAAGDRGCGKRLIRMLQPFVYRRYLDYGSIAALREMKQQIDEQVRKRGHTQDIKLGWGGIREVEFVVQVFQLVRGGAEPSLRSSSLMQAMNAIGKLQLFPDERIEALRQAYWFLRRVENCWQAQRDQQSHVLPDDEEPRLALACALGYPSWDALDTALQHQRAVVHAQFAELFAEPDNEAANPDWQRWWQGETQALPAADFVEDELESLRRRAHKRMTRPEERHMLGELLALLAAQFEDVVTARRVLAVIDVLIGRANYVSLLRDSPVARRELLHLCARSEWLATEMQRFPMVLAELLDPIRLYAPDDREVLRERLQDHLASLPPEDIEARMDVIRRVRHGAMLRIAAADLSAALPIMRVSDRLSELAEEILAAALGEAELQMRQRYPELPELEFAVIAYGKLGGLELGYGSDLDLIFVYAAQQTDLPLDPAVFYTRLAQKVIHFLATPTGAGRAYEIDTRLRPSGASGLLVTSVEGLRRYQLEKAWTWEHQALIRARPVAGSPALAAAFAATRSEVLTRPRDVTQLLQEVLEMRDKMRASLAPPQGEFDAKHSPGGIVDIEFLTQFAVLAHASDHPEIARHTDVIRILEALAATELIDGDQAQALAEAYRQLRMSVHERFLSGRGSSARIQALAADVQARIQIVQAQLST